MSNPEENLRGKLEVDSEVNEQIVARLLSGPGCPSAAKVERHNMGNLPFRVWCPPLWREGHETGCAVTRMGRRRR